MIQHDFELSVDGADYFVETVIESEGDWHGECFPSTMEQPAEFPVWEHERLSIEAITVHEADYEGRILDEEIIRKIKDRIQEDEHAIDLAVNEKYEQE